MKYYELDSSVGNYFDNVAEKALAIAKEKDVTVRFVFNEVACLVDKHTSPKLLVRDYQYAHLMEWKVIGPYFPLEYNSATLFEIQKRRDAQEEKRRQSQKEYDEKLAKRLASLEDKTKGLTLDLIDVQAYKDWEAKNTDGYSAAVFTYAKNWALLLQYELSQGNKLEDVAERTSHEADTVGLSGAQYGFAIGVLSLCWKHGERLKAWDKRKYKAAS